jgi:hypothetical protein
MAGCRYHLYPPEGVNYCIGYQPAPEQPAE